MTSKGQATNLDITNLLRSRHTLLWIQTREETRVERALIQAAADARMTPVFWDCVRGLSDATGKVIAPRFTDPLAMFAQIVQESSPTLYVMRDLHKWFDPPVLRYLRNLARALQSSRKSIVILTPTGEIPPELQGCVTMVDYPLPDRSEIAGVLQTILDGLPEEKRPVLENRAACVDAAVGLTAEEAANCYSKSLVTTKTIDPGQVAGEKKRVIAREKVLTWIDPDPRGLDAIGGLGLAKSWLVQRKAAFSERAKAYGLPSPKGILVVGPPGTGKSLLAKCVPTAFGMPLLRLDMGALKSKWVGESEANIRKALATAEAVAPCVVWLDEIEKALGGGGDGAADGGVSKDALGTILNWMQERKGDVFVVATANDVSALPPELLRKGRFDELFFVDLPTLKERAEILKATLDDFGSRATAFAESGSGAPIDVGLVAAETREWTGAELAALIPDAMFAAFADGVRQVTTDDLLTAAKKVIPLSKTASDKIARLREWAKDRCRFAAEAEEVAAGGRAVDLDEN